MTCIFNDIIRLDFTKYKQVLGEYKIYMREREAQEQADYEERKRQQEEAEANTEPPEKGKPPNSSMSQNRPIEIEDNADKKRIKQMASFLQQMARAAQFALNSQSWLQLVSIVVYVWNAFAYDLTNPLELCLVPEAWHSVVILAECSLYLLEFLKRGGKLRTLAG